MHNGSQPGPPTLDAPQVGPDVGLDRAVDPKGSVALSEVKP